MSDDWKSAGVAETVVQQLRSISIKIENRDVSGALTSLRNWERDLDFTGVPQSVLDETDLIVNTAMSFMKGKPPDTGPALKRLERAVRLWSDEGG